ncbi:MAG TPA: hypothetical protein VFN30_04250 [Chitinophagaceae bacterium]|nr:hypothetical protein [Chitinophagaceae bacterium]
MKAKLIFPLLFLFPLLSLSQTGTTVDSAINGLTKSVNIVKLGGSLIENTEINLSNLYDFSYKNGSVYYWYLKNNGNIGIGTSNPTALLHTTGSLRFQNLNTDNTLSNFFVSDANGNVFVRDLSSLPNVNIYNSNGTLTGNRFLDLGTSTLSFGKGANTNFHLFNNGNVWLGDGTPTDAGYKLDVAGNARFFYAGVPWYIGGDNLVSGPTSRDLGASIATNIYFRNNFSGVGLLTGNGIDGSSRFILQGDNTIITPGVVSFSMGTITPPSSALMDLTSTTKGFLLPRMTSAQRTAISIPATGLQLYQTDGTEGQYVNLSTGWRRFLTDADIGTTITSSSIYNSNGNINQPRVVTISAYNDITFNLRDESGLYIEQANTTGGGSLGIDGFYSNLRFAKGLRNDNINMSSGGMIISQTGSIKDGLRYDPNYRDTSQWTSQTIIDKEYLNSRLSIPTENFYTSNGTLTGNRFLDLGASTLSFGKGANTNFHLFNNGNVWLGDGTPVDGGYKLDVQGTNIRAFRASDPFSGTFSLGEGVLRYQDIYAKLDIQRTAWGGRIFLGGGSTAGVSINLDNNGQYYYVGHDINNINNTSDFIFKKAFYGGGWNFNKTLLDVGTINFGPPSGPYVNTGTLTGIRFRPDYTNFEGGLFGWNNINSIHLEVGNAIINSRQGITVIGDSVITGADTTAKLRIESTTKGFLLPRMTSAQRTSIGTPATGLQVYQTDATEGQYVNLSTGWKRFLTEDDIGLAWALNGNTVAAEKKLGTLDNFDLPIITNNLERMRISATGKVIINPALSATSNNDSLIGLDIRPSYSTGSFTGVVKTDLRTHGTRAVFGSSVGYGNLYGADWDGIVQIKEADNYATQLWLRPSANPSGFHGLYWGRLETDGYNLSMVAGGYQNAVISSTHGYINISSTYNYISLRHRNVDRLIVANPTGNILIGTNVDNNSAILNVSSTTQGFLPPRMTASQRTAIATPVPGLVVYQTDPNEGLYQYTAANGWQQIGTGALSSSVENGLSFNTSANKIALGGPLMYPTEINLGDNNLLFSGTGTGGIAIGTTVVPAGYKLAVNGDAIFTKLNVKAYAAWPDYVFDKNYKLPSLSEVEKYIEENKHLPEVPSAEEVEKNGLDVGSNQALLLKKIEELTMYLIEVNKKVEKISQENAELKKQLKAVKK